MVFFTDKANRAPPEEQADLILRRHLSFFASEMEDFEGFIAYHGGDDNPFVNHLKDLLCTFGGDDPRRPFGKWKQVDPPVQGSHLQDDLHGSVAEDHGAGGVAASLVF